MLKRNYRNKSSGRPELKVDAVAEESIPCAVKDHISLAGCFINAFVSQM